MSRKVGQIIARGERRWLVRVYLGRDRETRKRTYHNRTIYGSLRHAQAYLTRRLHERDLSRGVEGLQVTVDEFLDHWLKTAVKPKVRQKTYSDYAAILRRYIRPPIGARILGSLSPLEIQAAYQVMIDRKLSARTVRYAHAVLRAATRQAIRWQMLLNDPTQGVELPREQCREMSVLTTEQARSFLRTASHSPQACLFAVALTTGMRPSEYLALCWRDSTMHFAAAIVCDGFDAGYFQYLLFANSIPFRDSEIDAVIGTPAFGAGMPTWLSRSPGFLLDKVQTPILIQAIGPTSLMGEWEWFSGLTRLEKPVDLIYLPTGTHVLVKPWDRMTSEGGTVDWFCFWLKGQRDPASSKARQYSRWNNFRSQSARSGSPN